MKEFLSSPKRVLLLIIILAALFRLIRLDSPTGYVFDEVYHAFTAKEYLFGHKEAWEYWSTPPEGVAYEWTHPPLAKEIMAGSMFIFNSTDSWAWRLPGVIFGLISIYLVYLLGKSLFKSENVGLLSAFIYSIDGLNFVQSRTGMNDIYFVTFTLAGLVLFLRKQFFYSAILLGLSISSKWAGVYILGVYIILLFRYNRLKNIIYFLLVPPIIYMITYIPFFQLGHTLIQFKELQQQIWWYHTGLKASHDYASPWWSWPFNLYPVWYFVDYMKNGYVANIFASGNQFIYWSGIVAIILSITEIYKHVKKIFIYGVNQINSNSIKHLEPLIMVLLGFFAFWLPWAFSPRIMFLYHYLPSTPFLCILLAYQLNKQLELKNQKLVFMILGLMFIVFLAIFPILSGLPMPRAYIDYFFSSNLTKDPF